MRRTTSTRGFTLLELMCAFVIFAGMSAVVLVNQDAWTNKALGAIRARELRMLAERKFGEIAVFEAEFDDIYDWEDLGDEYGEEWEGWEWNLFIRDVVIFGETNDEAAEYLFGEPDEEEESEEEAAEEPQQKGETQFLRELTLTIRAPRDGENAGVDDSVTIVTFLPLVKHGPATPTGGPGGN